MFFFSSRRRHTRWPRDWSSDVCSSDLIEEMYLSKRWLAGIAIFPPTEHYKKKELTKFFEYMNAGLPIICSDFPVWKQFINKYECGITVDPYNETEIKNALDRKSVV